MVCNLELHRKSAPTTHFAIMPQIYYTVLQKNHKPVTFKYQRNGTISTNYLSVQRITMCFTLTDVCSFWRDEVTF